MKPYHPRLIAITVETDGTICVTNWAPEETHPYIDETTDALFKELAKNGIETAGPVCPIGKAARYCG